MWSALPPDEPMPVQRSSRLGGRPRQPSRVAPSPSLAWRRLAPAARLLAALGLPLIAPLVVLVGLYRVGIDLSPALTIVLVSAMGLTAALVWVEGLLAPRAPAPPPEPAGPPPPATALIAAYLPNEAATIVQTVRACLWSDYPGPFEVILAYNTPHDLPVEDDLRAIARRDGRFRLLRVEGSRSKAENVNAALPHVRGEIVGLFDADHHPEPGAFRRAWRWLAAGADVVQGHCVVRNGAASPVARVVAVEFEVMYAVSHPGRARLHGFGIFGGSNGYWHAPVLREIGMDPAMLTEDIDATIRALRRGYRIVSDPGLISRELAPVTGQALWHQRIRWSQGWYQVTRRHLIPTLRARALPLRQRVGTLHLLLWAQVYPWLAAMVPAHLIFLAWRDGGLDWPGLDDPLLLAMLALTVSVGPAQVLIAWRLAAQDLRARPWWFVSYLLVSMVVYTEVRNVAVRVSHLREAMGEHQWRVTPRTVPAPTPGSAVMPSLPGQPWSAPPDAVPVLIRSVGPRAGDGLPADLRRVPAG